MDDGNILGEGAYGMVRRENGRAIKTFKSRTALIQEYAAGRYLRNCPYVVKVVDVDFNRLELHMELYDTNLSRWLYTRPPHSEKMKALREILKALTYLCDLGLVHGDVKPGNILVNITHEGKLVSLAMGDLGFVGIEKFSKIKCTTPVYQEVEELKADFRHDIYSTGVMIIEMFGNVRIYPRIIEIDGKEVKKPQFTSRLLEIARDKVEEPSILSVISRTLDENRRRRPTARKLLYELFEEDPPIQCYAGLPNISNVSGVNNLDDIDIARISNFFKTQTVRNEKINQAQLAIDTTICYLSARNVDSKYHPAYYTSMMVIFSALFGPTGYNIASASITSGAREETILLAIQRLLNNDDVISYLFYTIKACKGEGSG